MARYIFVTGGVVSSLGKGLSSASLGYLLRSQGFKVRIRKMDPEIRLRIRKELHKTIIENMEKNEESQFMFDDNEYLDKVTVDIPRRRFTLLSSEGSVKNIDCDNGDEFMRILDFVRDTCTINDVVYI